MENTPTPPTTHLNLEKEIIHRYTKLNQSARIISQELGIADDKVYRILQANFISRNHGRGKPPISEAIVAEIIKQYKSGKGATTLAREYGISKKTVYNYLVRVGIGTRPVNDRGANSTTYHVPDGVLRSITPK